VSVIFLFYFHRAPTTLHLPKRADVIEAAADNTRVVGAMKEYRLTGWPELAPPFHRTAYRRMLSDMSQRFVTLTRLADTSGLKRHQVRHFLDMLESRHMVVERESLSATHSQFWSLRPLGGWLRRAISAGAPSGR
jgi:hypothetical protein